MKKQSAIKLALQLAQLNLARGARIRCFGEAAYTVKGGFLNEDYEQSEQIADLLNTSRREVDAADYA